MTTVMVEPFGWVYLVIVLHWYTKKIVGHSAGLQAKTLYWLAALDRAVPRQFPLGSCDQSLHRMSDTGCQPTAIAFLKACAPLASRRPSPATTIPQGTRIRKAHAGTLNEERLWLREWTSPLELEQAFTAWVEWDNTRYVHSALGYRTPCQVEQQPRTSHSTQFVAA
ncbi:MAG: hypothetical protein NNA18_00540 [Nitrospira sp.]|nr:hypothetical protein [Nitrospira sp.]